MESSYDKKYNLRLPSVVFDRVEELCHKYERSVNEQMVYMLKTWQEPAALEERLDRLEDLVLAAGLKKVLGQGVERKVM
jgi:predicted DNA-binding protein